jgi:hypothetical protein
LFESKQAKKEPVVKSKTAGVLALEKVSLVRKTFKPNPYLRKAALKETFYQKTSAVVPGGEEQEEEKLNSSHLITKILSKVMVS